MPPSRRALLWRGGLAAAALAPLAGCPAGRRRDPGRIAYPDWLYAPRTVGRSPHASFSALNLAAVAAHRDALRRSTYVKYQNYVALPDLPLEVDPGATDGVLRVFPPEGAPVRGVVLAGSYERDRLDDLRRAFDRRDRHRGVDVYWDGGGAAVGLGDRRVLVGYPAGRRPGRAVVAALLDARAGAIERYADASAAFATLAAKLGPGDDVSGFTHAPRAEAAPARGVFENAVAKGHRYVFGRPTSRSRYVFVFASAADVDLAAVRAWIDANDDPGDRLFGAYEDVAVSRDGRAAVLDGTVPTARI